MSSRRFEADSLSFLLINQPIHTSLHKRTKNKREIKCLYPLFDVLLKSVWFLEGKNFSGWNQFYDILGKRVWCFSTVKDVSLHCWIYDAGADLPPVWTVSSQVRVVEGGLGGGPCSDCGWCTEQEPLTLRATDVSQVVLLPAHHTASLATALVKRRNSRRPAVRLQEASDALIRPDGPGGCDRWLLLCASVTGWNDVPSRCVRDAGAEHHARRAFFGPATRHVSDVK